MRLHWPALPLIPLLASLLAACSTYPLEVQNEPMKGIHKIALLGLVVEQEAGPGSTKDVAMGDSLGKLPGSNQLPEEKRADEIYAGLRTTLADRLGFAVAERGTIENDPLCRYVLHVPRGAIEELPQPFQGLRLERSVPHGIGDAATVEKLTPYERKQVLERLHVDAFAVAYVRVRLNEKTSSKSYRPMAETVFRLFDARRAEALWSDRWATGSAASDLPLSDKLDQSVVEAANSSFERLVARYSEQASRIH